MTNVPLWIKTLQWVDRFAWYAYRAEEVVRDEIFRAWVDPKVRHAVTNDDYARNQSYLPGGATYERGLFDWEVEVLASDAFPKKGRILLGAAGGGRELSALCARGFEVVAFEPNDLLRSGAEAVARSYPGTAVFDATYDDLVCAVNTKTGPLGAALAAGPFDAVVLGWGSVTHVVTPDEQAALLRAVRVASPSGAVLLSFFMRPSTGAGGKSEQLRTKLRGLFARMGGASAPDGLGYEMNGGFVYFFTTEEVHALAFDAGYEVERLRAHPFPHAVLRPMTSTRPQSSS